MQFRNHKSSPGLTSSQESSRLLRRQHRGDHRLQRVLQQHAGMDTREGTALSARGIDQSIAVLDENPITSYVLNPDLSNKGSESRMLLSALEASGHARLPLRREPLKHTINNPECHQPGCGCLYSAIWTGDLHTVQRLIADGGEDAMQIDSSGRTLYIGAATLRTMPSGLSSILWSSEGQTRTLQLLRPGQAMTPLRLAARRGNLTVVWCLLQRSRHEDCRPPGVQCDP